MSSKFQSSGFKGQRAGFRVAVALWRFSRQNVRILLFLLLSGLVLVSCAPREEGGHRRNLWLHYRAKYLQYLPFLGQGRIIGNRVNCIARIETEIYVACKGGVRRWLGEGFSDHYLATELAGRQVQWLLPLVGGVAAVNENGISLFAGSGWKHLLMPDDQRVISAASWRGKAVLATGTEIYTCDGDKISRQPVLSDLIGRSRQLFSAGSGELLALLPGKLMLIKGRQGVVLRTVRLPDGITAAAVRGIVFGKRIWMASAGGLYGLDEAGEWRLYVAPLLGIAVKRVDAIYMNGDELWLAAASEVAKLSERDLLAENWHGTIYGSQSGLLDAEIGAICVWDREVWVGTRTHGVARFKRPQKTIDDKQEAE